MENFNNFPGDEEGYSCELRNFEFKFFAWPPLKRFASLSEQQLHQLLEQRHSALRDGPKKKQQTGLYQPFEVSNS